MARNGIKTGGRKAGTPNKATKDLRNWVNNFIGRNTAQLEKDWKKLSAKDRVIMFERLLKYSLPALSSVDGHFQFDNMTDEHLDKIINELQTKVRES